MRSMFLFLFMAGMMLAACAPVAATSSSRRMSAHAGAADRVGLPISGQMETQPPPSSTTLVRQGKPSSFGNGAQLDLFSAGLLFGAVYATAPTRRKEGGMGNSEVVVDDTIPQEAGLQAYTARVEALAVAKERARLARELHDSITQSIYSLAMRAEAASRILSSGQLETAASYLHDIQLDAREALREARLLVYGLRPPILEQEGLVAALRQRLAAVEARSGLCTKLVAEGVERLPTEIEMGLYRIAQEALQNVAKYARARSVSVLICLKAGWVTMEIVDDGQGIHLADVQSGEGMGLTSMRERTELLGGSFTVQRCANGGTRVAVGVPL